MKLDVNSSAFLSYLDKTTKKILSEINIKNYFLLTEEQKLTLSHSVFNALKTQTKVVLNNTDFVMFLKLLRKKNETEENYEFASILNDIIKNFDKIIDADSTRKNENKKKKEESK